MNRAIPLHNIPITTELSRKIKNVFRSPLPPCALDFATLERRIMEKTDAEIQAGRIRDAQDDN